MNCKCNYCGTEHGREWITWIINGERVFFYNICITCSREKANEYEKGCK